MSSQHTAIAECEFKISREFNAPRELVWQAWTQPERLAKWWGPKGCELEVVQLQLRPDGIFHYCMKFPSGGEMWGKFVYQEIAPPERLIYLSSFADADANTIRAPFSENFPLETMNTLTLTEESGKTRLTIVSVPVNATAGEQEFFASMHDSMQQGFGGTFEQLTDYLAHSPRN